MTDSFNMMHSYYKNIGWILLSSIAVTGLGYLLDNDPPYDKMSDTILEFSIITVILFTALSAAYLLYTRIKMKVSNSQKKS